MITKDDAMQLAEESLKKLEEESRIKLALFYDKIIEFAYGWVFLYQSEEYVITGNLDALVGGNAPIIVDKYNSSVHLTGTGKPKEFYIEQYCLYRDDIEVFRKVIR